MPRCRSNPVGRVGTLTACLASVIMLTQTSIKKKLAYSTISQMGFMLMQCGLGAYSAAMLHILPIRSTKRTSSSARAVSCRVELPCRRRQSSSKLFSGRYWS